VRVQCPPGPGGRLPSSQIEPSGQVYCNHQVHRDFLISLHDRGAMLDATERLWSQNVLTFPQRFRIFQLCVKKVSFIRVYGCYTPLSGCAHMQMAEVENDDIYNRN
jgi:hypothetical protein